jgi:hypothetical protein
VLGVSAGGEVAAEAHGDGAGGDLGEAGDYDQVRAGDSAEAGSEREGDGQAIGEADYDVADGFGGLEVMLVVGVVVGMRGDLMHGRSLPQADFKDELMSDAESFAGWSRL